jgi:hypothetical protein
MTGFHSKQAMAADKLQEPAQEPVAWIWKDMRGQDVVSLFEPRFNSIPLYTTPPQPAQEPDYWLGYGLQAHTEKPFENATALFTTPPKRQWIWLSDADIAEVVDTTCQYTGSYEEYLIKKAERKIRSMNT